ncbi:hypothetical protein MMC31_001660, partial [Peltigera leucophlebia]|nr:hypothetical protein [Peltigera leucophlebia]
GHPEARSLCYNTLHHRTHLNELFDGIPAKGDKSQMLQKRITALNNASELSEDGINNTDTLDDVHDEGGSGNNQDSSSTTAITQPISKKSRNARGDEPPPKRAKMTGGHILAESIVAVVEKMRASRKDRQEAIEGGLTNEGRKRQRNVHIPSCSSSSTGSYLCGCVLPE